jgi:S-formylglutathione hydrolase FrmB
MIDRRTLESDHLKNNLLGNPGVREICVYLPPSYADSSRHYAVVYLLHGFSSRSASWLLGPAVAFGAPLEPIDVLLDEAISAGRAEEMIVVMPDGWSKYGCAQWVDSPVTGEFEQHVLQEVIPYIDQHYRTLSSRNSRGITGISAGGGGAWNLGSKHPDVFAAVAPLAAAGCFDAMFRERFANMFDRYYPNNPDGPIVGFADSWLCYGIANAFTPSVDSPPHYADWPFRFPTGEVIPELWEKWLEHDMTINWRSRRDNLRQLNGILLDVGSRDEFNLHFGHRILSDALTGAGIKHVAREYEGGHTTYLQRERVTGAYEWFSDVLETSD